MSKLIIRAFEITDWPDMADIFLSPNCRWGTLHMPYQSRDEIRQRLQDMPPGQHRLVAEMPEIKKVIGTIMLHTFQGRRSHAAGLGMLVHDDYQSQGIGTKLLEAALDLADNWLNLTRLELTVYTDNESAIHLYKKNNFVTEGTLKKFAFRAGDYVDAYTMARLKDRVN